MSDEEKTDKADRIFFPLGDTVVKMKDYMAGQRVLPLIGQITEDVISQVIGMLLQFDFQGKEPIRLLINTKGGNVDQSYYLHDVINALQSPVDGIVVGKASSMGVDILQMCRKRLALPMSRFYCHFTRCGFQLIDNHERFDDEAAAKSVVTRLQSHRKERESLYVKRTKKTRAQVRQLFRTGEQYGTDMSAQEALKEGLIDGIVTDFKFFPGRHKDKPEGGSA